MPYGFSDQGMSGGWWMLTMAALFIGVDVVLIGLMTVIRHHHDDVSTRHRRDRLGSERTPAHTEVTTMHLKTRR